MKTTKPKEAKMWMVFEDEIFSFLRTLSVEDAKEAKVYIKGLLEFIDNNDADAVERLKAMHKNEDLGVNAKPKHPNFELKALQDEMFSALNTISKQKENENENEI